MRHLRHLVALLTVTALLSACATGDAARTLRGQAGRVAWEIVDIEQALEDQGFLMRWTFTIVLRNPSDVGIAFELSEMATHAVGTVDSIWAPSRLPSASNPAVSCGSARARPGAAPSARRADLRRIFADGIVLHSTLLGRDDAGGAVKVPVAIRRNSGVGTRR